MCSVPVWSGIGAMTGESSTPRTVTWNACSTGGARPSDTVIETLCTPIWSWVGVPAMVAGGVNTSHGGNVGAATVSGSPSGSTAITV